MPGEPLKIFHAKGNTMGKKLYHRKLVNLNVERQLQIWLLIRIGGIVALTTIISSLILYGYARHETIDSFYQAHIKIRRVSDLLLPVVTSGAAISLISGALLALFLPQKIAGPLYRIEQELLRVKQGDLTVKIKLRAKDSLVSFSQEVSATIETLDQRIARIQTTTEQLARCPDLSLPAQQLLAELQSQLKEFKTSPS